MEDQVRAGNPLHLDDLYNAFEAADTVVRRKYIANLSNAPCIELQDELKSIPVGENVELYHVAQIVYDKNESIQDKLTTVYSTMFSLKNYSLAMLLIGQKSRVDLLLGVVSKDLDEYSSENGAGVRLVPKEKQLRDNGKVLRNAFEANFPGTVLKLVRNVSSPEQDENPVDWKSKNEVISDAFKNIKYVAAVSSIPAIRDAQKSKNQELVQGLEKLIETMRGKKYTALILADPMDNEKIEEICAEYEDIYSQLIPFRSSAQTISAQRTTTDTEGIVQGTANAVNETIAKSLTHGTAESKTHTDSIGGSAGVSLGIPKACSASFSVNYSHAYSRTKTRLESNTDTTSSGTSKTLTHQNSVAHALSDTNGESLQLTYENRTVKTLLDRIDEQITRMRTCEDFGMFDTCAYFASAEYDNVIAAASAFKSLTRGERSSVEASAINVWTSSGPTVSEDSLEQGFSVNDVDFIKEYLMRFYHPEFIPEFAEKLDQTQNTRVTAAMLISGKEMAGQMALPKKSVAGLAVVECAEFGREVISMANIRGDIPLGQIYHMHNEDKNTPVKLNSQCLTAHTFITGSTGSGKSTTIYKMLDELSGLPSDRPEQTVKFMVIEPAKGEYKNALAANKKFDLQVFGTNPDFTEMLRINPFRFPKGKIHVLEHLDALTEIFNVCWPMYAAMPAVLKVSMENAYRAAGWDLLRSENSHGEIYPTFVDVALEVKRYIDRSEYSDENKSNYKGSLLTRLESLTNGINGMIFAADDISDEVLFDHNTIVDLSRIRSSETKALIMGLLVLKLQEYRMAQCDGSDVPLRHVTVLEEAHNLLKRTSTEQSSETSNLAGKSVEMLANAIAEMRTFGEGFIIADQSPGLLDMSVIRNTNTKIIMRLPDFSDRELVGKAAGLNDDQIVELSKLPKGVAAVYQNEWIAPVLCQIKKPELKNAVYTRKTKYPPQFPENVLFDLLDTGFRAKLDDLTERDRFRQAVLNSSISTADKVKLSDYLSEPNGIKSVEILAEMIFDHFRNAKETLEKSANELTAEELRTSIIADLEPAVILDREEQVDLLITLILSEYANRYGVFYPVWKQFLDGSIDNVERGDIV